MIDRTDWMRRKIFCRLSQSTAVFKLITEMCTEQLVAFETSEWQRMEYGCMCGAVVECGVLAVLAMPCYAMKNPKRDNTFRWKIVRRTLLIACDLNGNRHRHRYRQRCHCHRYRRRHNAAAAAVAAASNCLCRTDTHSYFFEQTQAVSECIVLRT